MRNFPFLSTIIVLVVVLRETRCSITQTKSLLYEFQTKLQHRTSSFSAAAAPPSPLLPTPSILNSPKKSGRVFYPIGYGADPTGEHDSEDAISDAINDAVELKNGLELLPGISDLGGIVIELQGGNFRIGNPIRLPSGIGNLVVQGGTLRASITFPNDRHLIELWSPNSPKYSQTNNVLSDTIKNLNRDGMQYEDVTFRDMLFDSTYQGGGLLVIDSARIRITNCFFLHFTTQGILIQRGHETFISGCFLGQHPTVGGDGFERNYTGTGIDIASTDNAVTDVSIFSAETGIILRGRANIITGVHCYNKAAYFGGIGILVKSGQNRIVDSYLDYNSIVIEDPDQILVSNGFFLGGGNIVLKAIQGKVSGLSIVNNIFSGDPKNMVPSVTLDGVFTNIDQVVIDQNFVNGMSLKSTVGKLNVDKNETRWVADFSGILLFPDKINHVQYAFYVKNGFSSDEFPVHAVTNVSKNIVVIESKRAVNAVVSVFVDQYNMIGEGNL